MVESNHKASEQLEGDHNEGEIAALHGILSDKSREKKKVISKNAYRGKNASGSVSCEKHEIDIFTRTSMRSGLKLKLSGSGTPPGVNTLSTVTSMS
jgi:hypothetical protein